MSGSSLLSLLPLVVVLLVAGAVVWRLQKRSAALHQAPHGVLPYGVEGWLALFIVGCCVFVPLFGLGRISADLVAAEGEHGGASNWLAYETVTWLGFGGFVAWQWWVCHGLLFRFVPRSVIRVKVLLAIAPVASVATHTVCAWTLLGNVDADMVAGAFLQKVVLGGVWLIYFARSKRVRNTYFPRPMGETAAPVIASRASEEKTTVVQSATRRRAMAPSANLVRGAPSTPLATSATGEAANATLGLEEQSATEVACEGSTSAGEVKWFRLLLLVAGAFTVGAGTVWAYSQYKASDWHALGVRQLAQHERELKVCRLMLACPPYEGAKDWGDFGQFLAEIRGKPPAASEPEEARLQSSLEFLCRLRPHPLVLESVIAGGLPSEDHLKPLADFLRDADNAKAFQTNPLMRWAESRISATGSGSDRCVMRSGAEDVSFGRAGDYQDRADLALWFVWLPTVTLVLLFYGLRWALTGNVRPLWLLRRARPRTRSS